MSTLHKELHFEAANYDKQNALYLPDLMAWLETTQPDSLQRLNKTHGAATGKNLAERVRKNLNDRGTLDVLRRGVEMLGLAKPLFLVQFKPALAINPVIQQDRKSVV